MAAQKSHQSLAQPGARRRRWDKGPCARTTEGARGASVAMSMSAAEGAAKAKYLAMTIEQLRRQCEDSWLSAAGTKSDLVKRLVDYDKPAGGWPGAAPAPAPAPAAASRMGSMSSSYSRPMARAPAPAPAPSSSSSSMSAAESAARAKYLSMNLTQLRRQCEDAWLSAAGTKDDLIGRLVDYEKPAGGWPGASAAPAPAPASRAGTSSTSSYGQPMSRAPAPAPSSSSSSMSAAESAARAKYLSMNLTQLRRQCEDAWLSAAGTKDDLIGRLVDYEKPAGGWPGASAAPAPAPASRVGTSSTSSYGQPMSRAPAPAPSSSSSSMSAAESAARAKYLSMNLTQLRRQCEDAWLSAAGTKDDLIGRLVDYEKPAGGWPGASAAPAPAPASRAGTSSTSSYGQPMSRAPAPAPSSSSSSMSAAESAARAKYLSMNLTQLRRQCEDAWLSAAGTKDDLIGRLVDYEKPAGGWPGASAAPAPAPASRVGYSSPSRSAGVGATPSYGSPSRPQGGADNELGRALSEKIKKALREQPNGVNIKDKFDRMDTLREGRLDRTSLRRGLLNELRVNLSPGEVDQVLGFVDTSRDGSIDYSEFLRAFGPTGVSSPGPKSGTQANRLREQIRDMIRQQREHVRNAYRAFGGQGDDGFGQSDFEAGLRQLHIAGSSMEIDDLFRSVSNSRGRVTYDDFVTHFAPGAETLVEVRALLKTNAQNVERMFASFDRNGDNYLSKSEFKQGLQQAGMRVEDWQVDDLMRIIDSDRMDAIQYRDFVTHFGPNAGISKDVRVGAGTEKVFAEVKQDLIHVFRQHGVNLDTAFQAFDRDGDGTISPMEFSDGLRALNVNLPPSKIQDIVSVMDKDRNGNIDYREFARQFGGGSSQGSSQLIAELNTVFRQHGVNLDTAFQAFDRDGDGTISPQEFRSGMTQLGLRLSNQQIEDTIRMMDPSGRGKIEYREFARRLSAGGGSGGGGGGGGGGYDSARPPPGGRPGPSSPHRPGGPAPGYPGNVSGGVHGGSSTGMSERVKDQLKQKFREHNVNLETAFSAFDQNRDGIISPSEMRQGLQQLNINLSHNDIDDLIRHMDRSNTGRIELREFVRSFGSTPSGGVGGGGYGGGQTSMGGGYGQPPRPGGGGHQSLSREVIADLKRKFQQHGVDLHTAFAAFDDNNDGIIDRQEMRRGLNALQMRLSDRDVDDIINHFDNDGNGRIEYAEFIRQFDYRTDNSRPSTLSREVIDTLKFKFRDHNVNVEQAFAAFDRDGDGSISPHEFRSGLTKLNIHIDYRQLNDVINHFDRNGTGQIQYREFAREFGSGAGTSTGNGGGVGVQSSQESLRLASAVVDEVKALLRANQVNLDTAFNAFDRNRDGRISRQEFTSGLQALNIGLTPRQIDEILRVMGAQHGQELAYGDFAKHFGDYGSAGGGAGSSMGLVAFLSEQVKQQMRSHGANLEVTFAAFDVNRDGTVNKREFEDGLRKLEIMMTTREIDECFRVLDSSRRGSINYKDFATLFSRSKLRLHYLTTEIRRSLALARVNLRQAFSMFDRNGTGRVSKQDFEAGIRKLNIRGVTERDIGSMISTMDVDRNGYMDYREFVRHFAGDNTDALRKITMQIRDLLEKHNESLMTAFRAFDRDRDGIISAREFRLGLRELGVKLSANQIDDIMRQLDVDEDGYIDYHDFLRHFGGSPGIGGKGGKGGAKKLKEAVFNELRAVLKKHNADLETAFRAFDTNGDGKLSRTEFENGLKQLNVDLTPNLVADVMREVDVDHSGFIDYKEFVKQFHQVLERNGTGGPSSDLKRENARLYERLKELERRLHSKDSEDAIRAKEAAHVKNMQVVFAQQCAQYEATIANLQHQLAMASQHGGGAAAGGGNAGREERPARLARGGAAGPGERSAYFLLQESAFARGFLPRGTGPCHRCGKEAARIA